MLKEEKICPSFERYVYEQDFNLIRIERLNYTKWSFSKTIEYNLVTTLHNVRIEVEDTENYIKEVVVKALHSEDIITRFPDDELKIEILQLETEDLAEMLTENVDTLYDDEEEFNNEN